MLKNLFQMRVSDGRKGFTTSLSHHSASERGEIFSNVVTPSERENSMSFDFLKVMDRHTFIGYSTRYT